MKSRFATLLLVAGIVVFAAGIAYAGAGHVGLLKASHHAARSHANGHKHKGKHKGRHRGRHHSRHSTRTHGASQGWTASDDSEGNSAAGSAYGTRPGKGCGDTNHTHTGPPGNPQNTSCPNHGPR